MKFASSSAESRKKFFVLSAEGIDWGDSRCFDVREDESTPEGVDWTNNGSWRLKKSVIPEFLKFLRTRTRKQLKRMFP